MNKRFKSVTLHSIIYLLICIALCASMVSCATSAVIYRDTAIVTSQENEEDRTCEIQTMLVESGYVKLGAGEFIVNELKMPANSCLEGIGKQTIIKTSNQNTSAIILGDNCRIDNLSIEGIDIDLSNESTACGVVIDGDDYQQLKGNTIVTRCYIRRFGKAGIYGMKTGYECENSLSASNCEIEECGIGVYCGPHFEYGRYTNILAHDNIIGCVNDGGNNYFVNCTFSKNDTAFMITNNNANDGHGGCVACTFNHNKDGKGLAISIEDVSNGFLFSTCNFWFGGIMINGTKGIMFNACIIGGDVPISGTTEMAIFKECLFRDLPVVSGNEFVFKDCSLFNGEAV